MLQRRREVTAWFIQIQFQLAYDSFNGLQGLILNRYKQWRTGYYHNIELKTLDKKAIVAPDKGKKVTRKNLKK
ncbi:MAG: hypothetical protein R2825_28700 [Saprospiraceae bacterium]